jgi:hypothetical protein
LTDGSVSEKANQLVRVFRAVFSACFNCLHDSLARALGVVIKSADIRRGEELARPDDLRVDGVSTSVKAASSRVSQSTTTE